MRSLIGFIFFLNLGPMFAQEEDILPPAYGPSRYSSADSPFNREILPPPPPEKIEAENPFEGLRLAGAFKLGNKMTASVIDRQNKYITIDSLDYNKDLGVKIQEIVPGTAHKDLKVRLVDKTGKTGEIAMDAQKMATIPTGAPVNNTLNANQRNAPGPGGQRNSQTQQAQQQAQQRAQQRLEALQAAPPGTAPSPNAAVGNAGAPNANPNDNGAAARQALIERLKASSANNRNPTSGGNNVSPPRRRVVLPN